MDHDDWLEPTALEETVKAFEDEEVVFTYSNSVNVNYKEN
jgi:cellulose synthase/poly-beta-1,6-N-acetylglucosamine synthase-like glycosyltransferase